MDEYQLTMDVTLVPSTLNIADRLMKVSQLWFDVTRWGIGPGPLIGAIHIDELDADQIMSIHRNSGHPGVWHTTYFIRRVCPPIIKAAKRMCEEYQLIDPAPIHWEKGKLVVNENWQRLEMDITHYGAHHFLC